MKMTLGTGAATNSLDDIELAKTIIVCGANPTEGHPVTGARIKQAVARGANLIIVDPRQIELSQYATLHLALRPGTNVLVFNAMAPPSSKKASSMKPSSRTASPNTTNTENSSSNSPPNSSRKNAASPPTTSARPLACYATAKPSIAFHGLGMTEHIQGTEGIMALVNIALLTGNIGKPGTGVNPLRGQNNVQGAPHMGSEPKLLAGYVPIEEARAASKPLGRPPAHHRGQKPDRAPRRRPARPSPRPLGIGYDILLTNPNAHETRRAFAAIDLIIVQDFFLNQTAREFGDLFLPAASSFEKDGTFMNGERRIQRVRKAVEPQGEARSDWQIVCDVARAMGHGRHFAFTSAEEIWDEVRASGPKAPASPTPASTTAASSGPVHEDDPGTPLLHAERLLEGHRATLRCIESRAVARADLTATFRSVSSPAGPSTSSTPEP